MSPRALDRVLAPADLGPQPGQVLDVVLDLLLDGVFGGGADDEPALGWPALGDDVAQPLALLVGGDAARHADLVDRRHVDAVAAGQGQVAGDPGALLGDRILHHLAQHLVAGLQQIFDLARRQALLGASDPRRRAFGRLVGVLDVGVLEQLLAVVGAHDVADEQEGGALDLGAEVDEGGLHAGQDPRDLAAVDVADHAAVALALDVELGERALLHHRDPALRALGVNHEDVLCHSIACANRLQPDWPP
jgi:hypothetical protein